MKRARAGLWLVIAGMAATGQSGLHKPPRDPVTWQSCEGPHPEFSGHVAPFSGLWYVDHGNLNEETWEFWGGSHFRHTWLAGQSADGARLTERGRFSVVGNHISLHVTSEDSAALAHPAQPDSAPLSGHTRCKDEMREMTLVILGRAGAGGLVLDGVLLRPRLR